MTVPIRSGTARRLGLDIPTCPRLTQPHALISFPRDLSDDEVRQFIDRWENASVWNHRTIALWNQLEPIERPTATRPPEWEPATVAEAKAADWTCHCRACLVQRPWLRVKAATASYPDQCGATIVTEPDGHKRAIPPNITLDSYRPDPYDDVEGHTGPARDDTPPSSGMGYW